MTQHLRRNDIVGKSIKNIYQAPWDIAADGFGSRETYIQLQDGIAFELRSQDLGIHPILAIDLSTIDCSADTEITLSRCIGCALIEVLVSHYWPGIGALLSNDFFIYQRDFLNPNDSRGLLIGGYAERVGERFSLNDVIPYWEQIV